MGRIFENSLRGFALCIGFSLCAAAPAAAQSGPVDFGTAVPTLEDLRRSFDGPAPEAGVAAERAIGFDGALPSGDADESTLEARADDAAGKPQGGAELADDVAARVDKDRVAARPVTASAPSDPPAEPRGVSMRIGFRLDSAEIEPEFMSNIAAIAEYLEAEPEANMLIVGHADASGDADYNLDLSLRRAESVRTALIYGFGIDEERLRAEGYGESEPLYPDPYDGRNRRVEFYRE